MGHERRRSSDRGKHKVMKGTGYVFLGLGMFVPLVTFIGYTVIWIIEMKRQLAGLEHIELSGPPWGTIDSIVYTAVLTLIGGYFFSNTDSTSGGKKLIGTIVGFVGRRASAAGDGMIDEDTDTVSMRAPAYEADEPEE